MVTDCGRHAAYCTGSLWQESGWWEFLTDPPSDARTEPFSAEQLTSWPGIPAPERNRRSWRGKYALTFVSQDGGPSPLVAAWAVRDWPPLHWPPAAATPGGFDSACPARSSSSARSHTQSPFHRPARRSGGNAGKRHSPRCPAWQCDRERQTEWKHLCHLLVKNEQQCEYIFTNLQIRLKEIKFDSVQNNAAHADGNMTSALLRQYLQIL